MTNYQTDTTILTNLKTAQDLADLLKIDYKTLIYYTYRNTEKNYAKIAIPKKAGGTRDLYIPVTPLKLVQTKLSKILQELYQPKPSVHGFVLDRSILTNVRSHTKDRARSKLQFVLNIDLKDFFPSINFGRVRGLFMAYPYNCTEEIATMLAQICCINNQLPQGAPTSPTISNMICARMDSQLQKLAKDNRSTYTRYADDITFSTTSLSFPKSLALVVHESTGAQLEIASPLRNIIENNGFSINPQKTRLLTPNVRQEITGITVNMKPNLQKRYYSQIRAMLHAWEKHGLEKAAEEHFTKYHPKHRNPFSSSLSFKSIVKGKIEYLGMIRGKDDTKYIKFMQKLSNLDPSIGFTGGTPMRNKVFISYSHKDKKWLEELQTHLYPIRKSSSIEIWVDTDIRPGDLWRDEIQKALDSAKVAILLVSPDFLASDFITNDELPSLFAAAKNEGLKLLWIPIIASSYTATPIAQYQALHDPNTPLAGISGKNKKSKALVEIVNKIMSAL